MKRYSKATGEVIEINEAGRRIIASAHVWLAEAVEDALDFPHTVKLEKSRVDALTTLLDKSAEGAYQPQS